jgi:hypothetical protein
VCEGGYELLEGDVLEGRNALRKKKNLNLHHQNFQIAKHFNLKEDVQSNNTGLQ